MTSKEMIQYENDGAMNNAFIDITLNEEVNRFFRPQIVSLARAMADGEPVMFDDIIHSLLATTTKVVGFLLNSTGFNKLTKEKKEIVVWQWYYNKLWNHYDGIKAERERKARKD